MVRRSLHSLCAHVPLLLWQWYFRRQALRHKIEEEMLHVQTKSGSEWPAGNSLEEKHASTQAVSSGPSILGSNDASPAAKQLCPAPSLGVIQEDEEDRQLQRSSGSALQDIQVST